MKSDKLRRAIGGIDADLIESADRMAAPAARRSAGRRIPGAALIAAILVLLLSVSAFAYFAGSHEKTGALLEKNPFSAASPSQEIDAAGQQIIDDSAIDLNLSQTCNGTTISIDSMMGFTDPTQSLIYLTFTVTPPEGYEFPEDMQQWCFFDERHTLVPDDVLCPYAGTTVKNPDGTASVLWALMPSGDPTGYRLHIEIDGFGTADKEVVASLYDGSRQIELPGSWIFDFTLPTLPETRTVTLDAAALAEAGLPVTGLRLSSFGGIAQLDHVQQLEDFTLVYADGTEYTVSFGEYGGNLWIDRDDRGTPYCTILFLNPQPISQATAIIIDGTQIPLQ